MELQRHDHRHRQPCGHHHVDACCLAVLQRYGLHRLWHPPHQPSTARGAALDRMDVGQLDVVQRRDTSTDRNRVNRAVGGLGARNPVH